MVLVREEIKEVRLRDLLLSLYSIPSLLSSVRRKGGGADEKKLRWYRDERTKKIRILNLL